MELLIILAFMALIIWNIFLTAFVKFEKKKHKESISQAYKRISIESEQVKLLRDSVVSINKNYEQLQKELSEFDVEVIEDELNGKSLKIELIRMLHEQNCKPEKLATTAKELYEFISEEPKKNPEIPTGFALVDVDVLTELYKRNNLKDGESAHLQA